MTADKRHVSRDIGISQVERYQCELGGLCFGVLLGAVDPDRFWQGEDFAVGGRGEAFGVPGTGGRESRCARIGDVGGVAVLDVSRPVQADTGLTSRYTGSRAVLLRSFLTHNSQGSPPAVSAICSPWAERVRLTMRKS